ncbi:adenine phosphoribosyltransferase [Annulohypoxylon truncatum]|uniref:adenine phosphoribosyltransferase n=1 Tax=Annulohypoxylon truncatum TaxID=327061 RepID=UPI002007C288|nr:adenine phosphoribosyltransferase [Annulohypoxylon truncatum]KAI1205403.1 adenine phosphoribosyltransferase [Annulohypoxylon truncatum]
MSGLSTTDTPADSVATNPSQPSIISSSITDASRREPASSAAGTTELAGQSVNALTGHEQEKLETAKKLVIDALRFVPDFPIPGINFIDILPIFQNPVAFESLLEVLVLLIRERFGDQIPDVIVGLEARGFLFGPTLALRLSRPFVPVRKKGKMPGACRTVEYKKEYGKDEFQVQLDAIKPGQTCLIVDDIIATGGTAAAAGQLVELSDAKVMGYLFMIEITNLKGKALLGDKPFITLVEHDEEE